MEEEEKKDSINPSRLTSLEDSSKHFCSLCRLIPFPFPIQCSFCQNLFCISCQKKEKNCQICKKESTLSIVGKQVQESYKVLEFRCLNFQRGCKQICKYDDVLLHQALCQYTYNEIKDITFENCSVCHSYFASIHRSEHNCTRELFKQISELQTGHLFQMKMLEDVKSELEEKTKALESQKKEIELQREEIERLKSENVELLKNIEEIKKVEKQNEEKEKMNRMKEDIFLEKMRKQKKDLSSQGERIKTLEATQRENETLLPELFKRVKKEEQEKEEEDDKNKATDRIVNINKDGDSEEEEKLGDSSLLSDKHKRWSNAFTKMQHSYSHITKYVFFTRIKQFASKQKDGHQNQLKKRIFNAWKILTKNVNQNH